MFRWGFDVVGVGDDIVYVAVERGGIVGYDWSDVTLKAVDGEQPAELGSALKPPSLLGGSLLKGKIIHQEILFKLFTNKSGT